MEKQPIRFAEKITNRDKIYLACLVFCAPIGLTLLISKRGINAYLNFYVLSILVSSWLNWLFWIYSLNEISQIIIATVIGSLPFAAYIFLIEERKFYALTNSKITILDFIIVITIPILSTQLTVMAVARLSGMEEISDCSNLIKMGSWGMIVTLIAFIVSLKHFVKNNCLLQGYFEYIPDNRDVLWIFSIIGIAVIFIAPAIMKSVPSLLHLLSCL
jgi:hypothetical protein